MRRPRPLTTVLAVSAALLLAGCELRRDGAEQSSGDQAEPAAESAPVFNGPALPEEQDAPSRDMPDDAPSESIFRDNTMDRTAHQVAIQPLELTISFADSATIDTAAERQLAGIVTHPAFAQDWPVVIGGHTDSSGNDQANLRASRARAEAVAAWLVERGVDDARIRVIGFGEQNPVAPNALPDGTPNVAGRRANRRVELRVAPPADNGGEVQPADNGA